MENLPAITPWWAVLMYLVVRDGIPIIKSSLEKLIPAKIAKEKTIHERQVEAEEKRLDLREREIVAMEEIGKNLVLMERNITSQQMVLQALSSAISTANQALAILLDRSRQYRRSDIPPKDTGPLIPFEMEPPR